ncbi:hypothetical protein CLD22_28410, partial [Rubrivivax gelatinosus]|nr:hypothetical protein [Rubrivivax gelatinosus]
MLALCERLAASASSGSDRNGMLAPPQPDRPGSPDTAPEHVRSRLHDGLFALARLQSAVGPTSPLDTITGTGMSVGKGSSTGNGTSNSNSNSTGAGARAG